jgi:hypothetical protein
MIRKTYFWLATLAQNKKHIVFVDVTVTSFAAYLGLKKTFTWSMTSLMQQVFTQPLTEGIIFLLVLLCVYASFAKIFLIVVTTFPSTRVVHGDGEALAECAITINREIGSHLTHVSSEPQSVFANWLQNHKFDHNIAYFTDHLHKHVVSTLSGAKKGDVFVSTYMVPRFQDLKAERKSLEYVWHSPKANDGINSRVISFSDGAHKQYECMKCIDGNNSTTLKLDCRDYYRVKTAKRHKSVKQYMGLKLEHNGVLFGFLNIELHNKAFFTSESEMSKFLEENVLGFKYLLEYQFLKSAFFQAVRPYLKE